MRRFFLLLLLFLSSTRSYCVVNFNFEKDNNFYTLVLSQFETERLLLIPESKNDHYELADLLLDHDVTRYMDLPAPKFSSRDEALEFLQEDSKINHFEWTIKTRDGISIGQFGVSIDQYRCVDIGYWLGKNFQKQGFAREACTYLCDKIFQCFDVKSLRVFMLEDNIRSIKLSKIIFSNIEKSYGEKVIVYEQKFVREHEGLRYVFLSLFCKKLDFIN